MRQPQSSNPWKPTHSGGFRYAEATLATSRLSPSDQNRVLEWLKNLEGFLIFMGCPGSGKTHFCYSLMNDVGKEQNNFYKRYWNESSFVSKIKGSFDSSGTSEKEIDFICDDDFVILDDMGSTPISEWKKDILLQFIDHRYESRKPTVITSNLNESDILEHFGARIHSRMFDKGHVVLSFSEKDWRKVEVKDRP